MAATKKQSISKRKQAIKYIVFPVLFIALLYIGAMQLSRISNLENQVQSLGVESFMRTVNEQYIPLAVDGLHKQAYIPELNIVLPYDNQLTSKMRYFAYQDDTSGANGVIQIALLSEMQKTKWTSHGEEWSGCRLPFYISVGASDASDGMKYVSQMILQDGRKAMVYENSINECKAFLGSADGGTILNMLQHIQSYKLLYD